MSVAAWGLLLDIIGVVLLGLSIHETRFGAGRFAFSRSLAGRHTAAAKRIGWSLLLLGFTLQLLAEIGLFGNGAPP